MADTTWADRVAAATRLSSPRQVGAVPVLYPLLEAMQVRETINTLRWTKSDVDFGRLVEILTLNRVMAPQPLSHVGEWANQTIVASMFGLKPEQLYDQRFGRGLDELHDFLARAWVAIAAGVVQREGSISVSCTGTPRLSSWKAIMKAANWRPMAAAVTTALTTNWSK
jgi:hypothetical protein